MYPKFGLANLHIMCRIIYYMKNFREVGLTTHSHTHTHREKNVYSTLKYYKNNNELSACL